MASKASLADQQKLVQENIHAQIKSFSMSMDEILLPDSKRIGEAHELPPQPTAAPRRSGIGFAVGRHDQPTGRPGKVLFAIQKTFPMLHYVLEIAQFWLEMFKSLSFLVTYPFCVCGSGIILIFLFWISKDKFY